MEEPLSILDYSAPHALFDGEFRYRSRGSLAAAIGLIVSSVSFGSMLLYFLPATERLMRVPATACSVLLLLAGLYLLYLWCIRFRLPARITEEGVQYGARIWAWPGITRIGGVRIHSGGVTLRISARGSLLPIDMPTTPALSPEEFAQAMTKVQEHITRHAYPTRVDFEIAAEG